MVAKTLSTTRDDAAMWTVRCAGLGGGLLAVLGAVMLGWLAWPALIGGVLGGTLLLGLLTMRGGAGRASSDVAQPIHRGIRPQAPLSPADSDTRFAA
jgi:hypothetical protein